MFSRVGTLTRVGRTERIFGLLEEQTGLLAKHDRTVDGRNRGGPGSEEALGLVDIVGALASSTDVLRVDRIDLVAAGTNAEDEVVLQETRAASATTRRSEDRGM